MTNIERAYDDDAEKELTKVYTPHIGVKAIVYALLFIGAQLGRIAWVIERKQRDQE